MPADYHSHTPLCQHAEGNPAAFVEAAVAAGLSEYGISDHAPVHPEPFDDWRMRESELPAYFDWLAEARRCPFTPLPCGWPACPCTPLTGYPAMSSGRSSPSSSEQT